MERQNMRQIKIEKDVGGIEGLCVIKPAVHGDARGCFMETYNEKEMKEVGIDVHFVQDNQSTSVKGVLRGMHVQKRHPQGKLVRVVKGLIFDVAVDMRKNSKTFGNWFGVELSEKNGKQLYIPEGFAHGFYVMSDEVVFCYKVTDFYRPDDELGIRWDDMRIKWPILEGTVPILSEKDKKNGSFAEAIKYIDGEKDEHSVYMR